MGLRNRQRGKAMREILFIGKTKAIAGSPYNNGKPDGEWVKGYLYNDVGCWKIRQFETDCADYVSYEVDPETVGQYTGMKDINDEKIFEGYIVKFKMFNALGYIRERIGVVKYYDELPIFYIYANTGDAWDWVQCDNIEVIGNIHDNPELMEGARD